MAPMSANVELILSALKMKGKALGNGAEPSVKKLETELRSNATFAGLTEGVSVPLYGADTAPEANRDDRVFQIACQYAERAIK